MNRYAAAVLILIALSIVAVVRSRDVLRLPSDVSNFFRPAADVSNAGDDDYVGTRWAVLIAGSNGYSNYRHQVKKRTSNDNDYYGSHVMQYGDLKLNKEDLFIYMGTNPANDNFTFVDDNSPRPSSNAVSQRDADLLYFWEEYRKAPEGSAGKIEAQKQLAEALSHRMHVDDSIKLVGNLLFGIEKGSEVLKTVRPAGQPFIDDWQCLKTLIRTFETHCGSLCYYGMKHTQSIANFCNAGIREEQMSEASAQACVTFPSNPWSSIRKGFSA